MNGQQRVLKAVAFEKTDRVPIDFGGMASTSISAFAYPKLREYLGLSKKRALVYDTGQMLALPDLELLDRFGVDVVTTNGFYTNAFDCSSLFSPYDFNGRLHGAVLQPEKFEILSDGTIRLGDSIMPPSAVVFNTRHAGNPLSLEEELYKPSLDHIREEIKAYSVDQKTLRRKVKFLERVRHATDRAIFLNGDGISLDMIGGIANGTMLCMLEPDYIHEYNKLQTEFAIKRFSSTFVHYKDYVDIVMLSSNDLGTQNTTYMPSPLIDELYMTYYAKMNAYVKSVAPHVKTFFHSCGAIYDLIDLIAKAGFDILNPVQWTAGAHTAKEWKEKAYKKICLWGGGIDSQHVLPSASAEKVYEEARTNINELTVDSGYVFCNIHNILAEIPPPNIVALYQAAMDSGVKS